MTTSNRPKGSPWTLLIVTSMMLMLNVISLVACRNQHLRYARLQAQIEALPKPSPDEEAIPETNRPRGQLSGVTGWAVFYGELENALAKVLWINALFVVFGLLWARTPRSG